MKRVRLNYGPEQPVHAWRFLFSHEGGIMFWLDAHGYVHMCTCLAGTYTSDYGDETIDLRGWDRTVGTARTIADFDRIVHAESPETAVWLNPPT